MTLTEDHRPPEPKTITGGQPWGKRLINQTTQAQVKQRVKKKVEVKAEAGIMKSKGRGKLKAKVE